ncbi:hypothetical protein [Streptomyces sp. NPDC048057]|uniref:hypothetical protein n=1 Tax=Streptomyces sp. NPDC048057 TaxID=3155628 RepID=UPI0033CA0BC1
MHAKFEIGMKLGRTQASSLVDLCTPLRQEAFFAQATEGSGRAPDPPVLVETADRKRRFGQFRSWHTTRDGRREADVLCRLSVDAPQPARTRVDESRVRFFPDVDCTKSSGKWHLCRRRRDQIHRVFP